MRTLGLAAVAVAIAGGELGAQTVRTTVVVDVADAETGAFIPSAEVRIRGFGNASRTDVVGQARFRDVPSGRYVLEVRRFGYEPLATPIRITGADSLGVTMFVRRAVQSLPPVRVLDSVAPQALKDFDARRRRGIGHFITAARWDSLAGLSLDAVLAMSIPSARVVGNRGQEQYVINTRDHCGVMLYWNGVQITPPNVGVIDPAEIGGIEFYQPSETPVQYRVAAPLDPKGRKVTDGPGCGVMLIWSRP